MKITNKSKWDTRDLIRFFRRCLSEIGEDIRDYTIAVKNIRGGVGVSGAGSYNRKWMRISLPTHRQVVGSDGGCFIEELSELTGGELERVAQVVIHESDHTRGLHHRDMMPSEQICTTWAGEFRIAKRRIKPEPTMEDRVRKRYERVLELIKKNEARLKRTRTRLKKLYVKKRYYEKKYPKIAAAGEKRKLNSGGGR